MLDDRRGNPRAGGDQSDQPFDRRARQVVARGGAQHRPGDRIELGGATGGDVALHRAAERVVRLLQLAERHGRIDIASALGATRGAALLDRPDERGAQLGGGADLAEQLVVTRSSCRRAR